VPVGDATRGAEGFRVIARTGMLDTHRHPSDAREGPAVTTGTYLLIVTIGFVLTLVVGQILMRSGLAFLRDVFDDDGVARSTTNLLGVLFHLVALGILALVSTWQPIPVQGTPQLVITQLGGALLVLGILHGSTLLVLSRVRSRRRGQAIEDSMTDRYEQQRRQRQANRQQVIEAGGNSGP
jgi:multisubunit Na+/H+ antiporter MnhG subunit